MKDIMRWSHYPSCLAHETPIWVLGAIRNQKLCNRTDNDDLWFLPGPPEDIAPTDLPWEVAQQQPVFAPKNWLRAEAAQGRGLVRAAAAFARLDARMTAGHRGAGFAKRLALTEVSALLWAQGDWAPVEKITLYGLLRESSLKDARALSLVLMGWTSPDSR